MADNVLLSGPAGGDKSELARQLLAELEAEGQPAVAADFQSIVVALLLLLRGPDGRYPVRPEWILPMAEYVRSVIIRNAIERDFSLVVTNSDGSALRRNDLLQRLGPGATERVVDPGRAVVAARLAAPVAPAAVGAPGAPGARAVPGGDPATAAKARDFDQRMRSGESSKAAAKAAGLALSDDCGNAIGRWYDRLAP